MEPGDRMKPQRRDSQNRLLCTAQRKHGRGPCNAPAIAGGRVCHKHGGAAPQVKESARLRLAALVVPAIEVLQKCLKDFDKNPEVAERAARAILDRTGYGAANKIQYGVDESAVDAGESARQKLVEMLEGLRENIRPGQARVN